MRKKLLAVTLALVVCLGGAMSVCAADMGTEEGVPVQTETTEEQGSEDVPTEEPLVSPENGMALQTGQETAVQAEAYQGFLNTVVYGSDSRTGYPTFGGTVEGASWTITPCAFESLTEAQQAAVKPLYDGMNAVSVDADRNVTWPQEKQVAQSFMDSLMGGSVSIAGDGFFFGKVSSAQTADGLNGIMTADGAWGVTSGFLVIQLKEDGTWEDVMVSAPERYTFPMIGDPKTDNPVLICVTEGTGSRRILYKNQMNSAVSAIAVVKGINIALSTRTDVKADANEAQKAAIAALENRISADPQMYGQILAGFIGEQGVAVKEVTSWGALTINAAGLDLSSGIPITFKADGITAGDQVVVLHLKEDGTWENIADAVAGNGTITGTFTSLSPVYYFTVTMPENAGTVTPPAGGSEGTGETPGAGGAAGITGEVHVHSWTETVVAPTSDTWGYTMYGCNECGYSYAENYKAPVNKAVQTGERVVSPKTGESDAPYAVVFMIGVLGVGLTVTCRRYTAGC